VLKRADRVAPIWDAQAELAALAATRRRRRRNQPPAWRDWLTRIPPSTEDPAMTDDEITDVELWLRAGFAEAVDPGR
jgi:hypothetical protein